ncbi:MAG: universal stress protein [Bacteroidetes bacterium]|nr:universal stress protein [Bacteroidota bacterium]
MKNILLPTDFSENSWNSIKYALKLFREEPCNFYILNSYRLPVYTNNEFIVVNTNESLEQNLSDACNEKMDALFEKIEKKYKNPKHSFRRIVEYNFFIDAVKEVVKKNDIDLIIMGTKGATGAKEIFIGTNTGDVINNVKKPILVIPENVAFNEPKEIAFPSDFKVLYKKNVLKTLLNIAKLHKSVLRIVHIKMDKNEISNEQLANKKYVEEFFNTIETSFHTLHNLMLEDALNCFTQSRDIDMIAMVPKNLSFFQKLFFKPKVEEISYHTRIPLLVLHESK